jgi:hypothetical protein
MKLSKKLFAFALSKGCQIVPITYWHNAFKSRGFDVVKEIDGLLFIQLKIKPVYYSKGDQWYATDYTTTPFRGVYTKNIGLIPGKFPHLRPQWTAFTVSGKTVELAPVRSN